MSERLILEINVPNSYTEITESYSAIFVDGKRQTFQLNLAKAELTIGSIITEVGPNSTILGTDQLDFIQADSGTLIVGNAGNDNLQVDAENGQGTCLIFGGKGDDTLRAISTSKTVIPSCILSGGEGNDKILAIGMRILVTDFEQGDRISIGDPNVQQILSEQGLILKTEQTEALILERFEPIPFVEGTYLGF